MNKASSARKSLSRSVPFCRSNYVNRWMCRSRPIVLQPSRSPKRPSRLSQALRLPKTVLSRHGSASRNRRAADTFPASAVDKTACVGIRHTIEFRNERNSNLLRADPVNRSRGSEDANDRSRRLVSATA